MAPPRPLTPIEKANLKRLLAEHDAYEAFLRNSPTAQQEREQRAAEECRLRAEQKFLAEQKAATAAKLTALSAALENVTEDLMAIALRNSKGDLRRVARAEQWLKHINVSVLKRTSPEDFTEAMHAMFQGMFPEFFQVEKQPTQDEYDAALDAQRAETAKQIVNAGRKARGDAPVDNIITVPFRKKET